MDVQYIVHHQNNSWITYKKRLNKSMESYFILMMIINSSLGMQGKNHD